MDPSARGDNPQDARMMIPAPEPITSRSNPLVKRLRALRRHAERVVQGAFLVEGILPVWRAVEHNADIETLVVAPELLRSSETTNMLVAEAQAGRRINYVSAEIFAQFAGHENPSGLAAIVRIPELSLDSLRVTADSVFTALFQPGNPGNLGTIVRTVEATGGAGVIVAGRGTDPYHPNAVKASMGTIFSVPVVCVAEWDVVYAWCRANALPIIGTSTRAPVDLWEASLPMPALLLLGSEAEGLPRVMVEQSDLAVRIPMTGTGSLNLAIAAAVLLYEFRRQHRAAG
jgi:RNA methyltransferase, TrmH family